MVGRHRRDPAPVVDPGVEQHAEVVRQVRWGLQVYVRWQDHPRSGDRNERGQLICTALADPDAEIRGARLQTLHAAWMIDQHGAKVARDEISAIKFEVANTMLKTVDTAIQVHGALGVTDDTILAYWYRHERAARIYDGADEVHKTTLGRRILRRYA
jgi:acyl-CoA dehydrogenase